MPPPTLNSEEPLIQGNADDVYETWKGSKTTLAP